MSMITSKNRHDGFIFNDFSLTRNTLNKLIFLLLITMSDVTSVNVRKGLIVTLALVTLATTLVFSYTMYLFIGVRGMLRAIEGNTKVDLIDAQINNGSALMNINISVNNPFGFSFSSYIEIKEIWVGSQDVKLYYGSEQFSGTFHAGIAFNPYSNKSVQFRFYWPSDVSSLSEYLAGNETWTLWIRMLVNTIINENSPIGLEVLKMYP